MARDRDDDDEFAADSAEAFTAVALVHAEELGEVAKEGLPFVVKAVFALARRQRRKKLRAYWEHVLKAKESAEEFQAWVNQRLLDDSEGVTAIFTESARAAADKASPAAIPSIGLLARRYGEGAFPKWFYRGALDLLISVRAVELGEIRDLLHQLASAGTEGTITVNADSEPVVMSHRAHGREDGPRGITLRGRGIRLLGLLKRTGLAHESGNLGLAGSSLAMEIEAEVVGWLCEVMPLPSLPTE